MLRELFDLRCSAEEEGIAAMCVLRGIAPTELALEPTVAVVVADILERLRVLPPVWCREIACQTLLTELKEIS
ncbi:MAG: hypothetical protein EBZ48_06525 [Proteobacteria bacterium]|nr:hypothetical protein [Pseudomonadota bacterium]